MADTKLTPLDTPDEDIVVPTPGDPVRAGGTDPGSVRKSLQRLYNKAWSIYQGQVVLRSIFVSSTNPGTKPALPVTDGWAFVNDTVWSAVHLAGLALGGARAALEAGRLVFTQVSGPAGTDPLKNELRPVLIPKAWGTLRITGDGAAVFPAFVDRANVLGVSLKGPNPPDNLILTITLAEAMADANYTVITGGASNFPGMAATTVSSSTKTARTFELFYGAQLNRNVHATDTYFVVFGRQNS